jgi:hypothetical protein
MSVHVTIETASRADAELIAALLRPKARAESWRGYGVIRLGRRTDAETAQLIETVGSAVERHELGWARVRYDDDERVFRGNGRHHAQQDSSPGLQTPQHAKTVGRSFVDAIAEHTLDWGARTPEPDSGT